MDDGGEVDLRSSFKRHLVKMKISNSIAYDSRNLAVARIAFPRPVDAQSTEIRVVRNVASFTQAFQRLYPPRESARGCARGAGRGGRARAGICISPLHDIALRHCSETQTETSDTHQATHRPVASCAPRLDERRGAAAVERLAAGGGGGPRARDSHGLSAPPRTAPCSAGCRCTQGRARTRRQRRRGSRS